jgi:hypothetical protein
MDDLELIKAVELEMKFIDDPNLDPANYSPFEDRTRAVAATKLKLIKYFMEAYQNTDQDTVTYGPEFVIVVRTILEGKRPVKLRFLTDFKGEEK